MDNIKNDKKKFPENVMVWGEVYTEQNKQVLRPVVLELASKGKELADQINGRLLVAVIGHQIENCEILKNYGVDEVYLYEHNALSSFTIDLYVDLLSRLIRQTQPEIVLFGATLNGRALAPRVAARLETGLTADCTDLALSEDGLLKQIRPAFGGNIMATIISPQTRPQMATVRPHIFKQKIIPAPSFVINKMQSIKLADNDRLEHGNNSNNRDRGSILLKKPRIKTLQTVLVSQKQEKIENADIVFAIGRGIQKKENIDLVKEMAQQFRGVVACSRAIVELGWMEHAYQVGQSGKTISPKIYIAIGISGSVQHLVGMRSSEIIIAINKDPEASIFKIADFGLVGDFFKLHPHLKQHLSRVKSQVL